MDDKKTTTVHSLLKGLRLFLQEMFLHPRQIGAAFPSSHRLADAIVELISPIPANSLIIELGAGTGVITQSLLAHGVQPENLLVIERSRILVKYLQATFPNTRVIQTDASEFSHHMTTPHRPVHAIVSSLPFRSLGYEIVYQIVAEIEKVIQPETKLIQFTYSLLTADPILTHTFDLKETRYVWLNLPPAKISVFKSL